MPDLKDIERRIDKLGSPASSDGDSLSPESGGTYVENPYDPPTVNRKARIVLERHGDRLVPAPRGETSPTYYQVEQPWWRTTKGLAIGIPALVAGLSTITPTVVIPIIKAIREPYEGAKIKNINEAKAASEQAQSATAFETKARLASEQEIYKKITEVDGKASDALSKLPAVKANPNRQPR